MDRHQGDRGEAGAGGGAEAAAEEIRLAQRQQREGHAEHERRRLDRQTEGFHNREQQRPRKARDPFDPLAEIEDEAVAMGEVAGVAEGDEGVVDRPDREEQQRQ